jgi:hypothetical protein
MFRIPYIVICLTISIFALEIQNKTDFQELLAHSKIYIDKTLSLNIQKVKTKKFNPTTSNNIGFGYSPNIAVWVKFTLLNKSSKDIHKILEYDNPLTSYVTLYDTNGQIRQDGLLVSTKNKQAINPIFDIHLKPKESKTYYLKAYSNITTLRIKLHLYNPHTFYKKEMKHQLILALFFGAMGLLILYNFIIYLSTREKRYLYYVLSFIGILFYYLLYMGIANIYLFNTYTITKLIEFSSFLWQYQYFSLPYLPKIF